MVVSLKQRYTESNKGLVKPFERPDTSFSAQIQLHVNGKFKNSGFKNTLPKNTLPLPHVKPTDKKPLFQFIQPEKVSGWERTGYQLAKGQQRYQNDLAKAKEFSEYLGVRVAEDAKYAAPSIMRLVPGMNGIRPPPAPSGSGRDPSALHVPSIFHQGPPAPPPSPIRQGQLSSTSPMEIDPWSISTTSYTPVTPRTPVPGSTTPAPSGYGPRLRTRPARIGTSNLPNLGDSSISPFLRDFQRRGGARYINGREDSIRAGTRSNYDPYVEFANRGMDYRSGSTRSPLSSTNGRSPVSSTNGRSPVSSTNGQRTPTGVERGVQRTNLRGGREDSGVVFSGGGRNIFGGRNQPSGAGRRR